MSPESETKNITPDTSNDKLAVSSPHLDEYLSCRFGEDRDAWLAGLTPEVAVAIGADIHGLAATQESLPQTSRDLSIIVADLTRVQPDLDESLPLNILAPLAGRLSSTQLSAGLDFYHLACKGFRITPIQLDPANILELEHGDTGLQINEAAFRSAVCQRVDMALINSTPNLDGRAGFFSLNAESNEVIETTAHALDQLADTSDLSPFLSVLAFATAKLPVPEGCLDTRTINVPNQHSRVTTVETKAVKFQRLNGSLLTGELSDYQRLALVLRSGLEPQDVINSNEIAAAISDPAIADLAWLSIVGARLEPGSININQATDAISRISSPDLAKTLGRSVETMQATEPTPQRVSELTARSGEALDAVLGQLGYSKAELADGVATLEKEASISIGMSVEAIVRAADAGRLKSSLETFSTSGTSGRDSRKLDDFGRPYYSQRSMAEEKMGIKALGTKIDPHPISGFLFDPSQSSEAISGRILEGRVSASYGDVRVNLKPDVSLRTVFVYGDSANEAGTEAGVKFMDYSDAVVAKAAQTKAIAAGKLSHPQGPVTLRGWNYVEAIVLGGVKLSDISSVEIAAVGRNHTRILRRDVVPFLEAAGLTVTIDDGAPPHDPSDY